MAGERGGKVRSGKLCDDFHSEPRWGSVCVFLPTRRIVGLVFVFWLGIAVRGWKNGELCVWPFACVTHLGLFTNEKNVSVRHCPGVVKFPRARRDCVDGRRKPRNPQTWSRPYLTPHTDTPRSPFPGIRLCLREHTRRLCRWTRIGIRLGWNPTVWQNSNEMVCGLETDQ